MSVKGKIVGAAIRVIAGKEGAKMWTWFSGKKLAIGVALEALGELLHSASATVGPIFEAVGLPAESTAAAVAIVGRVIAIVGGIHKVVKTL
jgi:hypothetical protein